jgi:predicted chitinase
MGLLGQGIRATIGLKNAAALQSSRPDQQSEFNAAYLFVSLMIGFIAGILAGFAIGLDQIGKVNPLNVQALLGIAAAGYAGADFIENSFSKIIPKAGGPPAPAPAPAAEPTARPTVETASTFRPPVPPAVPIAPSAPVPVPTPSLVPAFKIVAAAVNTDVWAAVLTAAFAKFQLTTNRRMAAAIGQFLVEAGGGFQELVENLDYTHASRIAAVFPTEFPTEADAANYVGNPEALGNVVYANKLGNGDTGSGDGYRFRGRGLIQLTGRAEYGEFAAIVGMTPEQAAAYCETPEGAAMSGCWYLASRGCQLLADTWQISKITEKVNGAAMEGNDQRISYSNAFLKALGG